jgi:hypothetical protein
VAVWGGLAAIAAGDQGCHGYAMGPPGRENHSASAMALGLLKTALMTKSLLLSVKVAALVAALGLGRKTPAHAETRGLPSTVDVLIKKWQRQGRAWKPMGVERTVLPLDVGFASLPRTLAPKGAGRYSETMVVRNDDGRSATQHWHANLSGGHPFDWNMDPAPHRVPNATSMVTQVHFTTSRRRTFIQLTRAAPRP